MTDEAHNNHLPFRIRMVLIFFSFFFLSEKNDTTSNTEQYSTIWMMGSVALYQYLNMFLKLFINQSIGTIEQTLTASQISLAMALLVFFMAPSLCPLTSQMRTHGPSVFCIFQFEPISIMHFHFHLKTDRTHLIAISMDKCC